MKNVIYVIGVIIAFLGVSGVAEAITGRGSGEISTALFIIGFICALYGYQDMWKPKKRDPFKDL